METLSQFGQGFQTKVITSMIFDKPFLQQIYDIIRPEYFENKAAEWIVKEVLEHYDNYKTTPTMDVMKVRLDKIKDDDILSEIVIDTLKDVVKFKKSDDLPFVKEQALEFCKNQIVKLAIYESVELLEQGNYEEIKKLIDTAMKAGSDRDFGHDWKADVHLRYEPEIRNPIATPWPIMNELLQDGLGDGELGVVVSPSGAGKSWILAAIGAHAVKEGKNVLHITLELDAAPTGKRYDSILTGIPNRHIKDHEDEVVRAIESIPGQLLIKRYPAHRTSVIDLSNYIDRIMSNGFVPDMIIVDYGDLIRPVSSRKRNLERRFELEEIYTDLRQLGSDYNVPLWTASQTNRGGINLMEIEADSIGEAYNKVMIADFIFSNSRTKDDKNANTARFHVIKNRFGPDGLTYPVSFDGDTGRISMYDPKSPDGMRISNNSMSKEEAEKAALRKKLDAMKKFGK